MTLDLASLAGWATIGQFVIAFIALLIQLLTTKIRVSPRIMRWFVFGSATLLLPGVGVFMLVILVIRAVPATAEQQILRAMLWTITLGTGWGVFWGAHILPRLTKRITMDKVNDEKSG
jgi:hypothetical protein